MKNPVFYQATLAHLKQKNVHPKCHHWLNEKALDEFKGKNTWNEKVLGLGMMTLPSIARLSSVSTLRVMLHLTTTRGNGRTRAEKLLRSGQFVGLQG